MNNEKIEEKKKEIKNYERILAEYRGRWWDQSKRHLDNLREELKQLQTIEN